MKRFMKLSIVLFAFACNDEDKGNSPADPKTVDPFPTEVGIETGSAVTTEIGPEGGTISSQDGVLNVVVPQGAVSGPTGFSVQPLASFCPGAIYSYRLLPENITFETPVKLVFNYTEEDISGTIPELLGVAYQADDNVWYTLPNPQLDQSNKTVGVDIVHFTDWTLIEYLNIYPKVPDVPQLRINETIDLSVIGQGMSQEADDLPPLPTNPGGGHSHPSPDEDELAPLPIPRPFKAKWFVNGVENGNDRVGRITPGNAAQHLLVYKAPATTPVDEFVLITAEITGLKKWTRNGRSWTVSPQNKIILFKRIRILPDEYNFKLKIEWKHDQACGYSSQVYHDLVEMDVNIKGEDVSILNIENQEPSVNPATIRVLNCDLTSEPGLIGELNVTAGSGRVFPPGWQGDHWRFELTLEHTQLASGASCRFDCDEQDPIVHNHSPFTASEPLGFVLKDSTQHAGSPPGSQYGRFITLTPKR